MNFMKTELGTPQASRWRCFPSYKLKQWFWLFLSIPTFSVLCAIVLKSQGRDHLGSVLCFGHFFLFMLCLLDSEKFVHSPRPGRTKVCIACLSCLQWKFLVAQKESDVLSFRINLSRIINQHLQLSNDNHRCKLESSFEDEREGCV